MGSGSTTKRLDAPRLRSTAIGSGGGASTSNQRDNLCPDQFNIQFKHPHALTFVGKPVKLDGKDVLVGGIKLFELSKQQVNRIETCRERGISYTGVVFEHKNKYYVEFSAN